MPLRQIVEEAHLHDTKCFGRITVLDETEEAPLWNFRRSVIYTVSL